MNIIVYLLLFFLIILLIKLIQITRNKEHFKNSEKAIVFKLGSSSGFFSMLFFMCHAYIYAKKANYDFFIDCDEWTYKINDGWHDYFLSLRKYKKEEMSDYKEVKIIENYNEREYTNEHYTVDEYHKTLHEIFILKPELDIVVKNYINNLNNDYISIYIRRGDKLHNESTGTDLSQFVNEFGLTHKNNVIFVQTDDYNAVDELKKLLPQSTIKTLTNPEKHGSDYTKLNTMNKSDLEKDTNELLIACMISIHAKNAYIDTRSNVGRFIKLYAFDKNNVIGYPINKYSGNYLQLTDVINNPAHEFEILK